MILFLILLFLLLPITIVYLSERYVWLGKIGPVIIAYIFGVIIGHCGLFPHPSDALMSLMQSETKLDLIYLKQYVAEGTINQSDLLAYRVFNLQELISNLSIPLALPLLLFSLKIKVWFRMSYKTMLSMFFAIIGVVGLIVAGFYIYGESLYEPNKIAGLMVGLYTGGTPNLASLKQSLNVDIETYLMTHTFDTAVGVIYLLFLITVGKNILRKFLLPYPKKELNGLYESIDFNENAYKGFFKKAVIKKLLFSLFITIIIIGISIAFGKLVKEQAFMLTVILSITSLGIIASFIPKINNLPKTFELGMYFIIVFSLVVASMADISKLINISSSLFAYISLVYFGALIFHAFLCKVFKVDADTLMVTSTALLCSPPFVPMVAGALKNKEVIVSGLTVGIMGYAIGNYLGALLAGILGSV